MSAMVERNVKPEPKNHHFIPITYLEKFSDSAERVWAYRKDGPFTPIHIKPKNIGFERYYYSQPTPGGGQDNKLLESLFGEVEGKWNSIVSALEARGSLRNDPGALFNFIALMRVRGPAARDAAELMLAEQVKMTGRIMKERGQLPPPPPGLENLMDMVDVSIDPHMSLHAMPHLLKGVGELLSYLGFEAVHNQTDEPFITSDNPVIYFDPDAAEDEMLPYTVRPPLGRVELLFPISPKTLLHGRSELWTQSRTRGVIHKNVTSRNWVKRANRLSARFAYRLVIANRSGLEGLVERHAAHSPVGQYTRMPWRRGEGLVTQMVFGPRPAKPKWKREPGPQGT